MYYCVNAVNSVTGKVSVSVYYMEVNSVQESVKEVIDKTRADNEPEFV